MEKIIFFKYFHRLKSRLAGKHQNEKLTEDELLRSELFSAKQMRQHGKTIAGAHKLNEGLTSNQLLERLTENEKVLFQAREKLTKAVLENRRVTPAEEWFLDNFYLIEEQIRTARRHLPKVYSRELPHLLNGPSAYLPRVYDIALEMISPAMVGWIRKP